MHDALHSRLAGRVEERARVLGRLLMAGRSVREAHPVGVVERGHALEVSHERGQIREVERTHLDLVRVVTVLRMPREGAHGAAAFEQSLRDRPTAVAERAGHDVDTGVDA